MKFLTQTDGWRFDRLMKPKPTLGQNGQSRVLERFRQIFPLALFQDELIVEELRVIWIKKKGPWTSEVISIMATDIACVYSSRGPLFGNVEIQSVTGGPEICVDKLLGKDAYRIRDLVEGIALASREGLKIEREDNLEEEKRKILRAGQIRTSTI